MASHEKILYDFYGIYWRPPKREEFKACGGNLAGVEKMYDSYDEFIKKMGYGGTYKGETYIVINLVNQEEEFIGIVEHISDEYGWTPNNIRRNANKNVNIDRVYRIKSLPFSGNIYERGLVA